MHSATALALLTSNLFGGFFFLLLVAVVVISVFSLSLLVFISTGELLCFIFISITFSDYRAGNQISYSRNLIVKSVDWCKLSNCLTSDCIRPAALDQCGFLKGNFHVISLSLLNLISVYAFFDQPPPQSHYIFHFTKNPTI